MKYYVMKYLELTEGNIWYSAPEANRKEYFSVSQKQAIFKLIEKKIYLHKRFTNILRVISSSNRDLKITSKLSFL